MILQGSGQEYGQQPLVAEVVNTIIGPHSLGPVYTVDTLKWGNLSQPVSGIACTFMATVTVIKQAKRLGCNLIITHEPTFYAHDDLEHDPALDDEVVVAKKTLLQSCGVSIWRWHDHCHWCSGLFSASGRDSVSDSFVQAVGWEKYRRSTHDYCEQNRFDIPSCTLWEIASHIQKTLCIPEHAVRVAGDLEATF